MGRKTLLLLAVATLGVFSAVGMRATNFQIWDVNGTTVEAMWEGTPPSIKWNENFTTLPSNVTENGSGVAPMTVLTNAFSAWSTATYNGTPVTNIEFTFGSASASFPQAPTVDCQNVIGFDDTTTDFGTGVIAFTSIATVTVPAGSTVPFAYSCGSNNPSPAPTCSLEACIVDVDIMFNPKPPVPFSTSTGGQFATSAPTANQYDLQSIATHEIGHMIGLDHSGIAHAVMYPYGDTSSIGIHQGLWTDDMIGAGHLYPGAAAPTSEIQGHVAVNSSQDVYAAHVEAVDSTTGNAITDTLTDPSGNYRLLLFGGTFYVFVQSLAPDFNHGPCTIGDFSGQAGYGNNDFADIPANSTGYTGKYY